MALNINSISELYDTYKPAYSNIYEIFIFNSKINNDDSLDLENYIKFHAVNVSIEGESLELTRNEVTKQFQLNDTQAFKRVDNITIQWREEEHWKVKKYHEQWLGMFYDKEHDCYMSYSKSDRYKLYRTIKVILPHEGAFNRDCDCLCFYNVLPQNAPGLSLSWSPSASIVTHSLNYYVTNFGWSTYSNNEENS